MKSVFEKLQDYFNNTSQEQIKKDWYSLSKYDKINSPTVGEFIDESNYFFKLEYEIQDLTQKNFVNNIKNPKLTSDFFLNKTYGKSKLLNRTFYL